MTKPINHYIDWTTDLIQVLRDVSDEEFQRRAWTGKGPEVSSPTEIYCALFDDKSFENFLSDPPKFISATTIFNSRELIKLMGFVDEADIDDGNPMRLIEHPLWKRIRELAAQTAGMFEEDLQSGGGR